MEYFKGYIGDNNFLEGKYKTWEGPGEDEMLSSIRELSNHIKENGVDVLTTEDRNRVQVLSSELNSFKIKNPEAYEKLRSINLLDEFKLIEGDPLEMGNSSKWGVKALSSAIKQSDDAVMRISEEELMKSHFIISKSYNIRQLKDGDYALAEKDFPKSEQKLKNKNRATKLGI